jgi:hypothetical protein
LVKRVDYRLAQPWYVDARGAKKYANKLVFNFPAASGLRKSAAVFGAVSGAPTVKELRTVNHRLALAALSVILLAGGPMAGLSAGPLGASGPAPAKSEGSKNTSDKDSWKQISPQDDVWINSTTKQVKVAGEIVLREGPLELFACLKQTKEHEAIVACTTKAYIVHAGLLAVGAVAGQPVQFRPDYKPVRGTEVEVFVEWSDADGKIKKEKAQDWIRNAKTGKALDQAWIFGGSAFYEDETTGEKYYQAESGDFICVSNFPSAMLDLPIKSTDSDSALMFEAFSDRIPPLGTKVTLYLVPKIKKPDANKKPAGGGQRGDKPPAVRPTRPAGPAT